MEVLCGAGVGALAAWHAQKLRACFEQRAAAAKLQPGKREPSLDGPCGKGAEEPPPAELPGEAEVPDAAAGCGEGASAGEEALKALEPYPAESRSQSCADDAAGPPARDVAAGVALALASGRSPRSLELVQIGTPVAPEEEVEGEEGDVEDEAEAIAAAALEGPHTAESSAVGSTTEHYCIASFIGSEGSWGSSSGLGEGDGSGLDCCVLADDGLAACSTEGVGRRGSGTSDGTSGTYAGSVGRRDEAFQLPPALAARISGRCGKFYAIEVSGATRALPTWRLHRRYSEFVSLDQQIRHKFAGLPKLPRKSVFSKRFNPGFLQRREQGLEAFLTALVAADPVLEEPAVRAFVDPEVQLFQGAGKADGETASERSSCRSCRSSRCSRA